MTGKWNESMSYQPCDMEGEPLPGTELKEVFIYIDANDSLLISLQGLFCQSCLEMLAWKLAHKPHICRSGMLRRCQKMTNFNTLISPTSWTAWRLCQRSSWHLILGFDLIDMHLRGVIYQKLGVRRAGISLCFSYHYATKVFSNIFGGVKVIFLWNHPAWRRGKEQKRETERHRAISSHLDGLI